MFDTDLFPYTDVAGPPGATNNAIALFNGSTGKILKDSGVLLPAGPLVDTSSVQTLTNKYAIFSNSTNWGGSAGLEVRGNGATDATGGAFMTFHRPSAFAANLGFDQNNLFKLSGFSLGANVPWSVTTSGVMQVQRALYFGAQFQVNATTSSTTINFSNGQKCLLYLTSSTNVWLSFPGVGNYVIIVAQDGTGNRTVTWSGISGWIGDNTAPAIALTANGYSYISVYWNGSAIFLGGVKINAK